jgi:hypothetical protein
MGPAGSGGSSLAIVDSNGAKVANFGFVINQYSSSGQTDAEFVVAYVTDSVGDTAPLVFQLRPHPSYFSFSIQAKHKIRVLYSSSSCQGQAFVVASEGTGSYRPSESPPWLPPASGQRKVAALNDDAPFQLLMVAFADESNFTPPQVVYYKAADTCVAKTIVPSFNGAIPLSSIEVMADILVYPLYLSPSN